MANVKRKKKATALSRQVEDPLWQSLDKKIGGRVGLMEAALSSTHPKAQILAELCMDKAFSRSGTKALAKRAGMGADDIVDLYRNQKWLEATLELHSELPAVIKGAVDDAKPTMVPCEACKGTGVLEGIPCWVCKGAMEVRKSGDKDKLTFVGKATGMIDKGGPLIQNTNIQVTGQPGQDSFENLMRRATVKIERKQVEGVIDIEPEK